MNTRYYFSPELLANCSAPASYSSAAPDGENSVPASRNAQPRVPPVSFLVRAAIRVSRARWFSLLRRVFHYQNGSRSDLASNPLNSGAWLAAEFIAWVVQIGAIAIVLAVSRGERPVWPLRIWVLGYAAGSLLSLPLLYWRCRHLSAASGGHGFGFSDVEQQRINNEESRSSNLMNKSRTFLELFFAIWFVMGNVWVFDSRHGTFNQAPNLHVLCISLLAWNAIAYSFPFLLFVLLCCCVPLVSNLLGYNMNMGAIHRGASEDQISCLPKWKFKEAGDGAQSKSTNESETSECCICLAKYREKEEVRQLPCSHLFHLRCVDQWLRIVSCCPLCKQDLDK